MSRRVEDILTIEEPRWKLEIGGKSPSELERMLNAGGIKISSYVQDILRSRNFITLKKPETIDLVLHSPKDFGLTEITTTVQIYEQARERGYDLCPAEAAVYLRLAYRDQREGEWLSVGMKQIADRGGHPHFFGLARRAGRLWLHAGWAGSGSEGHPEGGFVFRLRKELK